MSIKKSIGWTDMTLNPIKGRCKGKCWYCYFSGKRGILNRFKLNPKIRLVLTVFDHLPKSPKKIFLCSTHDLFGDWIPSEWRDAIFRWVKFYPQHTFQVLTKFPHNISRAMPDNVWLGVSITGEDSMADTKRIFALELIKAKLKFISYEPLLDEEVIHRIPFAKWIIVGRLTGFGKKYDPRRGAINFLVESQRRCGSAIFLKDNLKEIWGEPLIQEFPNV